MLYLKWESLGELCGIVLRTLWIYPWGGSERKGMKRGAGFFDKGATQTNVSLIKNNGLRGSDRALRLLKGDVELSPLFFLRCKPDLFAGNEFYCSIQSGLKKPFLR